MQLMATNQYYFSNRPSDLKLQHLECIGEQDSDFRDKKMWLEEAKMVSQLYLHTVGLPPFQCTFLFNQAPYMENFTSKQTAHGKDSPNFPLSNCITGHLTSKSKWFLDLSLSFPGSWNINNFVDRFQLGTPVASTQFITKDYRD